MRLLFLEIRKYPDEKVFKKAVYQTMEHMYENIAKDQIICEVDMRRAENLVDVQEDEFKDLTPGIWNIVANDGIPDDVRKALFVASRRHDIKFIHEDRTFSEELYSLKELVKTLEHKVLMHMD